MPLPVVSGAQAVRALERAGWVVARRKGSHVILKKPATFHIHNHALARTSFGDLESALVAQAPLAAAGWSDLDLHPREVPGLPVVPQVGESPGH
jgi:predicted RNA binding protein YcfA (HicA-like mRNA interferase family)